MRDDWTGRVVLVTGATRGIGAQMVAQLVAAGARVLAVARDGGALEALATRHGDAVDVLALDLAEPDMPRAVAHWVADCHPACSVLINNAAVMRFPVLTEDALRHLDGIDEEIRINLVAPLQIATGLLPVLARNAGARVVNVTSGLAVAPKTDAPVYCATKAGLRSFTRALRYQVEDAGLDISVSEALLPVVDTTLSRGDPARKMAPERAAALILEGALARRAEIWIGKSRLLPLIMRLSPGLGYGLLRRM